MCLCCHVPGVWPLSWLAILLSGSGLEFDPGPRHWLLGAQGDELSLKYKRVPAEEAGAGCTFTWILQLIVQAGNCV